MQSLTVFRVAADSEMGLVLRTLLVIAGLGLPPLAAAEAMTVFPGVAYGFPVPPDSELRLFYVQRSMNANTIVYDANLLPDGRLDPQSPVSVYWLRYHKRHGKKKALDGLERTFVWGVQARAANDPLGSYHVNLVSYKGRKGLLTLDDTGRPYVRVTIDSEPAKLQHVFLELDGDGKIPDIEYAELFGQSLQTGHTVYERIVP